MDLLRKGYRKPKGRPCNRRFAQASNAMKHWNKSVNETDDNSADVKSGKTLSGGSAHKGLKINCSKKQVLDLSRNVGRRKYIDCDSSFDNAEIIDVGVSYDGHKSLRGTGIIIDILIGLVIDSEVLSEHCYDFVNSEGTLGKNTAEFRF
ncbi:hypothetical protein AVEN_169403-1 [Araneus ventricosus]|uniref:Uncharacterized protein n=1 Tax=Araneus ventricosus TaxID=182803 RepID=A0A4Y2J9Q1_ARAVE|nr:hypothetical protein AVEN_169403-1 [Araneus ventricosus]